MGALAFVVDDLTVRFLANIPKDERTMSRLFWQILEAHWFYLDFMRPDTPSLPKLNLRDFAWMLFQQSPLLKPHASRFEEGWEEWQRYRAEVPTYGCVLVDAAMEQVLVVRGFASNAGYSFPKGKLNAEETPMDAAVREVWEEVGFDVKGLIHENDYIEASFGQQVSRMYIILGVPLDTAFETHTRAEIGEIRWWPIAELPGFGKTTLKSGRVYMIRPFVAKLKQFLKDRAKGKKVKVVLKKEFRLDRKQVMSALLQDF